MKRSFLSPKKKRGSAEGATGKHVDYKDIETLMKFVTERGKLIPRRMTGVSFRFQRRLTQAIKRARYMALLPFVTKE